MTSRQGPVHYPRWLRAWHWTNAALFLALAVTGLSMHYADAQAPLIPFRLARLVHNAAGLLIDAAWVGFLAANARSGNVRHYQIRLGGLLRGVTRQARWYLVGIFRGERTPYPETARRKFNPLQALTYALLMYGWFPLLAGTGVMLLFPELAPARVLGWGGVWPAAVLHLAAGFGGTLFLVGHCYLATTGRTVTTHFKAMINGNHAAEDLP